MNSLRSIVRRGIMPGFFMILLAAASAFAAVPNRPIEFSATVYGSPAAVKLTWQPSKEGATPTGYKVYAAQGETEDLSKFEMILDTKETKAVIQNRTGVYTFFVRAYNADGESERTVIKVVNIKAEEPKIKFLTTPKTTVGVNQQYVYEAKAAYGNTDQSIRYKLISGPDGMRINEETGRIEWTTGASGKYAVVIRAYLASNDDIFATQEWSIIVGEGGDAFRFTSTPPKETAVGKELVYEAKAVYTPDANAVIVYSLVGAPDGMTIDAKTGRIVWTPLKDGVYVITVVATLDGKPDTKTMQKFELRVGNGGNGGGDNSAIKFKSEPKSVACVGKEYVYTPMVVNLLGNPAAVVFTLTQSPEAGIKIDEKTGTIRWTPEREGEYNLIIVATVQGTSIAAKQAWTLKVRTTGCEEKPAACAFITGKVTDANGQGVRGWVMAIRTDKGDGRYKGEFKDGMYKIAVPEGTYALNVGGDDIISEWYLDAESLDKATPVSVKCNESATADMTVARREAPKAFVISGKVTDANGAGVMAVVSFIVKENNGIDNKEKSAQFVARTDINGTYSVKLTNNFAYIALATPVTNKYLPIYFDNTPNPQEATIFKVDADREINFTLPDRPTYNNGFSGQLVNQDGAVVTGKVVASRIIQAKDIFKAEYASVTVETDADGNFTFTNLLPGKYVLLGVPSTRDWAPGYYRQDALAVMNWKEATQIEVAEVVLTQNFVIKLRKVEGKVGGGHIDGHTHTHKGSAKSENVQALSALAGVFAVAYDDNGLIADYAFSNADGSFSLSESGAGAFNVVVEKPNYELANFSTTIDYKTKAISQGNDVTLIPTSPAGVYEDAAIFGASVYPNPAANAVTLHFNGTAGNSMIAVVNTVGATMQSFVMPTITGENSRTLELSTLESGLYFVRVSNGTAVFTIPVTIAR